jgi:DNA-binding NarL/FixJ family response regulator
VVDRGTERGFKSACVFVSLVSPSETARSTTSVLVRRARAARRNRSRIPGEARRLRLSARALRPCDLRPARILAAADAYQAMREPRPYLPPRTPEEAASELRADVKAGRLDSDAVEAVLGAAGHRVPRRRGGPAGLTAREVEVLRLLARGLSNKEMAARLVISPKTVASHVEHIYAKIDASTRATASLFAMQYGLLPEDAVEVVA